MTLEQVKAFLLGAKTIQGEINALGAGTKRLRGYIVMPVRIEDCECCPVMLVFAENEKAARRAMVQHVEWATEVLDPEDAYIRLHAYRAPEWDERADELVDGARYIGPDAIVPGDRALYEVGFFDPMCE